MSLPREHGFWLWYAVSWVPLFAAYFLAFTSQGVSSARMAAIVAAANVVPDALLGIGLVRFCRRLWERGGRRKRVAWLAAALAFVATASLGKSALNVLVVRMDGGRAEWSSLDRDVIFWAAFFSLLVVAVLTSVTFAASAAARVREEEARRSRAELLRARSELKALRAQLNPHFLFNTLHSVRALIREDAEAAEEAVEQLGDLLRYSLRVQDAAEDGVLLREEWEFVRAYLSLERIRLGERLRVEEDVSDAALERVVPAFVLQPLVENAIRHGIGTRERGGTVSIHARLEDDSLRIDVRDDGQGSHGSTSHGTGKGLELVRQRLRALYGANATVEISAGESGFAVTLRLPCEIEPR